jgi:hypothetical protein
VQSVGPPPAKFVTTLGCAVSFVESVSGPLRQLAGHTRASAGEATHVQLACDQLAAAAPAPHHQTPCRNRGAWAGRRRRRLCLWLCWWWSLTCHEALRRNENRATEPSATRNHIIDGRLPCVCCAAQRAARSVSGSLSLFLPPPPAAPKKQARRDKSLCNHVDLTGPLRS